MDELDRAIAVAERDPARFSIDVAEIERRKKWTSSTHSQVCYLAIDRGYKVEEFAYGRLGGKKSSTLKELVVNRKT